MGGVICDICRIVITTTPTKAFYSLNEHYCSRCEPIMNLSRKIPQPKLIEIIQLLLRHRPLSAIKRIQSITDSTFDEAKQLVFYYQSVKRELTELH